jgi:hypothetical protein
MGAGRGHPLTLPVGASPSPSLKGLWPLHIRGTIPQPGRAIVPQMWDRRSP